MRNFFLYKMISNLFEGGFYGFLMKLFIWSFIFACLVTIYGPQIESFLNWFR